MNLNSLIIAADACHARLFRTARTNIADEPVELIEVETLDSDDPGGAEGEHDVCGLSDPGRVQDSTVGRSLDNVGEGHDKAVLRRFARQIADQAAKFAQYHLCNPVIVVAPSPMTAALVTELQREIPQFYLRTFIGESAGLPPRELLDDLDKRGAFTAVHYPFRA